MEDTIKTSVTEFVAATETHSILKYICGGGCGLGGKSSIWICSEVSFDLFLYTVSSAAVCPQKAGLTNVRSFASLLLLVCFGTKHHSWSVNHDAVFFSLRSKDCEINVFQSWEVL